MTAFLYSIFKTSTLAPLHSVSEHNLDQYLVVDSTGYFSFCIFLHLYNFWLFCAYIHLCVPIASVVMIAWSIFLLLVVVIIYDCYRLSKMLISFTHFLHQHFWRLDSERKKKVLGSFFDRCTIFIAWGFIYHYVNCNEELTTAFLQKMWVGQANLNSTVKLKSVE